MTQSLAGQNNAYCNFAYSTLACLRMGCRGRRLPRAQEGPHTKRFWTDEPSCNRLRLVLQYLRVLLHRTHCRVCVSQSE